LASGLSVCKINQFLISKTSLDYTAQYIVQAPILFFHWEFKTSPLDLENLKLKKFNV